MLMFMIASDRQFEPGLNVRFTSWTPGVGVKERYAFSASDTGMTEFISYC